MSIGPNDVVCANELRPSRPQEVSPSFATLQDGARRAALRVGDPPPLAVATPNARRVRQGCMRMQPVFIQNRKP